MGDELISDDGGGKMDSQLVRINNLPIEIDDRTSDAIVIPCCKTHARYAKLRCCYTSIGLPCNEPICDMCLYSREQTVSHYPTLKPVSHLLCMDHYKLEVNKVVSKKTALTMIKIEGEIDRDSQYFIGDNCPYCSSNRNESVKEETVIPMYDGVPMEDGFFTGLVITHIHGTLNVLCEVTNNLPL